jgi:hypothetical protein
MRTILILLVLVAAIAAALVFVGVRPMSAPAPAEGQLPPETTAPGPSQTTPTATPVLVQIDRTMARTPANGGSAVVLFTEDPAIEERNLVTCINLWNTLDSATTSEIQVGLRRAADGAVEALRPTYWPTTSIVRAAEPACESLMAAYDYARARTIRAKYGLTSEGPYLVVARTDEQAAATINLTGKSDREIADLIAYFRDGFAYQADIWDPARMAPERKTATLAIFFGPRFRESLTNALSLVSSPAARAGCSLGDLADAPCS